MSERDKFAAGRQRDAKGGVVDIKLCPSDQFKGDASVLAKAYNAFDQAASQADFIDRYEEQLERVSVETVVRGL